MFDRLQKPFLTVETGEAYQPVRLSYDLLDEAHLTKILETLNCLEKNPSANTWNWFWRNECDDVHFESLESFRRTSERPIRLGTLSIRNNKFYINLPSFKRACLSVPFFYKFIADNIIRIKHADFINKVFAIDERLPHGFTELFKDEELEKIVRQRVEDYHKVHEHIEEAATAEEAFHLLSEYTRAETKKRLPYAERYYFVTEGNDPEVLALSFYIFLRGRELVAIRRWYGETGYTLSNMLDEVVEQIFGSTGMDLM